jgi:heterodisulfide reductase subunit C2
MYTVREKILKIWWKKKLNCSIKRYGIMTLVLSKEKKTGNLADSVRSISGVDISECLQCKKCSNGCPVATLTKIGPAETIRRLQLNAGEELLDSDLVWMCVSCETCFARCPMKIDMAAIMDALRIVAVQKKPSAANEKVHQFNKSFLNTVKLFGRTYDLGMIASYKFGTSTYMQDTDKFPMMLRKRKIALLPSFRADKKYIKRIFRIKDKMN